MELCNKDAQTQLVALKGVLCSKINPNKQIQRIVPNRCIVDISNCHVFDSNNPGGAHTVKDGDKINLLYRKISLFPPDNKYHHMKHISEYC